MFLKLLVHSFSYQKGLQVGLVTSYDFTLFQWFLKFGIIQCRINVYCMLPFCLYCTI
uniref:Uncharacterized protein n=1 Tax=Rhizophora mucronata TaxID=61149 RepID=A0A2P2QTG1_RHIMU